MSGGRMEGKARSRESKGAMTVSEAGHLGGEKTARTHGHEFYQEIGHKGGEIGGQRVKTLVEEGKEQESEHGVKGQSRRGSS